MLSLANSTSSPCPSVPATLTPSLSQSLSADSSPFKHAFKHPKEDTIDIKINATYLLDNGLSGRCVFIGNTSFARGEWIGLVVENTSNGNNNGTINNKQYFICANNKGLFVRKEKIIQKIHTKKHKEKNNKHKENTDQNNRKIAVSFFNHKHIESTNIEDVFRTPTPIQPNFNHFNEIKKEESDSELSLDFGIEETPSTGITECSIDIEDHDNTPDTFSKLNDYFSEHTLHVQVNHDIDDEQRRRSMNETLNDNDTVLISALPPVKKRMRMYSSSEQWSQIQYKINEDKNNFLEPKVPHTQSTNSTIKKMGPIDIGRIIYETPFHEIEKSPFNIEQYKTWYPRKTPCSVVSDGNKKKIKFKTRKQRSASTIDTKCWRRKNNDKVWIEKKLCLVRNPNYRAKVVRNIEKKRVRVRVMVKKKKKKKKKTKYKSSRSLKIMKQKQKMNGKSHKSVRTSSGPLIRLNGVHSNGNNINVIMEDYCTDVEENDHDEDPFNRLHRSQSHSPLQNDKAQKSQKSQKSQSVKRYNDTQTIKVKHFFL